MGIDYHELAREGRLAQDFDQWDLKNPDGWSVAHEAARTGHLPPGFTRWEIRDADGWTVAHEAAMHVALPPDFNRWDLADFDGYTVAHTAAEHGHLPPDFPHMEWADVDGLTVSEVHARGLNTKQPNTEPAQKPKNYMRTMVFDFSSVRPPDNSNNLREAATINRLLRKYPCDIVGGRIRLHPELKVTLKELVTLRKYLMRKGHHTAKDAVSELNDIKVTIFEK